ERDAEVRVRGDGHGAVGRSDRGDRWRGVDGEAEDVVRQHVVRRVDEVGVGDAGREHRHGAGLTRREVGGRVEREGRGRAGAGGGRVRGGGAGGGVGARGGGVGGVGGVGRDVREGR